MTSSSTKSAMTMFQKNQNRQKDPRNAGWEISHLNISLTEDAHALSVWAHHTPSLSQYHDKLKQEIGLLVNQRVISPLTEPTDWCSPIVVALEKGTERIRFVCREHYPSITPAGWHSAVKGRTLHSVRCLERLPPVLFMDEESITIFITLFGHFKYRRALYGISFISEHYDRCMDEALSRIWKLLMMLLCLTRTKHSILTYHVYLKISNKVVHVN